MVEYFTNNCFDLLQSIIKYLHRELKIPEYSEMFETEDFTAADFQAESVELFDKNPILLEKLEAMKERIIEKVFEIIDVEGSEVTVSLLVYESF